MKKFCTKGIYASGMVLQQNTVNCIFGETEADSLVTMEFRGKNYCAKADSNGCWKIEYNPGEAGGPFNLLLKSQGETIEFSDVYTGEVWISSGQSNAQLPMERMYFSYQDEFSLPENKNIRMITVPISFSFDGEKDSVENPEWICASPQTLGRMSGTGYFFAKKLYENSGVPVGIINASQGGSPISAWMNEKSFAESEKNSYSDYLERIKNCRNPDFLVEKRKEIKAKQDKWNYTINSMDAEISQKSLKSWEKIEFSELDSSWENCTIPDDFSLSGKAAIVWFKKEIILSAEQAEKFNSKNTWFWFGTIQDADKAFINGTQIGITYYTYPPRRYKIPSGLLKEGKNTITIRCQKNGKGDLRFYREKHYCIFTEDVKVHPVAFRNVEVPEKAINKPEDGEFINLAGQWKMRVSCQYECYPGELFFEWEPSALYNSMLAPAFNYAAAGTLWYQGESDAEKHYQYKDLLIRMIKLWREKFVYAPKNMPFVIMQLPNWSDGNTGHGEFSDWALLRQAQEEAVYSVENAALSVCIDAGEWNDLHPEKKKTAGTRAALQALRIGYGKPFSKPARALKIEKKQNTYVVEFTLDGNDSLQAYKVHDFSADFSMQDKCVLGFEFLTDKKDLYTAKAEISGSNTVEVQIPEGKTDDKLTELRFLWANNPDVVNLYTKSGLPVSSFRFIL